MHGINREAVETFLYREAALLDAWRLQEWLELFTPEAEYLVPPLDARDLPPEQALYLVADDYLRLNSRVKQLLKGNAHSENPGSRTRRAVTNVLFEARPDGTLLVSANFVIHRIRRELMDVYVGRYEHVLVQIEGRLRFKLRKSILDLEALRPQGKISIIL
jgi:p-cumate 2,3-dioxygenase subunit beta